MICNFLGNFEKPHSFVKLLLLLFGQLLETFGYFLVQHLVTLTLDHSSLSTKRKTLDMTSKFLLVRGFLRCRMYQKLYFGGRPFQKSNQNFSPL